MLDSLRAQLGISDKDHQKIVGELSAEERQLFDPAYQGSVEQRLARQQYRKDLERIVVEAARSGTDADATLAALRAERGVDEDEEHEELAAAARPRRADRRDLRRRARGDRDARRRGRGREPCPTARPTARANRRASRCVRAPRACAVPRARDPRARRARGDDQARRGRAASAHRREAARRRAARPRSIRSRRVEPRCGSARWSSAWSPGSRAATSVRSRSRRSSRSSDDRSRHLRAAGGDAAVPVRRRGCRATRCAR